MFLWWCQASAILGFFEFFRSIYVFGPRTPLCRNWCVLTAKTKKYQTNTTQNNAYLLAASQMNGIAGLYMPTLRGAVSTAEVWTFFEYTTTFPQPKGLNFSDDEDEDDEDEEEDEDEGEVEEVNSAFTFVGK